MVSNGIELPVRNQRLLAVSDGVSNNLPTPIVNQKRIYIRNPKASNPENKPIVSEPEPITSEPEQIQPEPEQPIQPETIVKKEKKPRTEKQIQAFLKMKEAQEARQVVSRDNRKQEKQVSADEKKLQKLRASILELEPFAEGRILAPAQPALVQSEPSPAQPVKKTRKPYVRRESTRESTTPEFQVSTDREIIFM